MKLSQKRTLPALISFLVMTGCASDKVQMLPDSGPTTKAVYDQHVAGSNRQQNGIHENAAWHATLQQVRPESDWSRSARQNLDTDFQRIPNPELTGYVFPHLTRQGYPVPGYMTRFPLYEQNAYALPGEVPVPLANTHETQETQETQP